LQQTTVAIVHEEWKGRIEHGSEEESSKKEKETLSDNQQEANPGDAKSVP
jgi:hypothetical protein